MEQKRRMILKLIRKRLLVTLIFFVFANLIFYIIDPHTIHWQNYFKRSIGDLLHDWLFALTYCFTIVSLSAVINKNLNKKISWTDSPQKRLLIETLLNLVMVIIVQLIVNVSCRYFANFESIIPTWPTTEAFRGFVQWIVVSMMMVVIIMGVNIVNYLSSNWRSEQLRTYKLNQAAMEVELQALKLQIDPHFVFNNLSVLSELILEDQQVGHDYAENFSKIYRYMLVNSKKDIISLEVELKFLKSYIFLLEHRFGNGVHFDIQVNSQCKELYIPPLTLQMLVENVFKHNKLDKKTPLQVSIYTIEDKSLVVENRLNPVEKPVLSSQIGIKNIKRRYLLLSDKEPNIVMNEQTFKVTVPLLSYDK